MPDFRNNGEVNALLEYSLLKKDKPTYKNSLQTVNERKEKTKASPKSYSV